MLYQLNCSHSDRQLNARNPSWTDQYYQFTMTVDGTYTAARVAACQWLSRNVKKGRGGQVMIIPGGKERTETIFRFDENYHDKSLKGRYGQRYSIDKRTKRISLVDYRTGRLGKTVETWGP